MGRGIETKRKIAEAFKVLMIEKSFEEIHIKDITDECNISRLSFYYHYQDKYDLLNKIFYMEVLEPVRGQIDLDTWPEMLLRSLNSMRKSRKYYIKAMSINSEEYKKNVFDLARKVMNETVLKIAENEVVNPNDLDFISGFFAYGLSGMVHEWCMRGMNDEPSRLVSQSVNLLEDLKRFAAVRYFMEN